MPYYQTALLSNFVRTWVIKAQHHQCHLQIKNPRAHGNTFKIRCAHK